MYGYNTYFQAIFGEIFRTTGPDLPFEDVKAGPVAVTEKRETMIDEEI